MKNIEQYKNRFYNLMESTIGNVKPLINEENDEQGWLDQQKKLDDIWNQRDVEKLKSQGDENERREREDILNRMVKHASNNLSNYIVDGSQKILKDDDSTFEFEFKLKIYKNAYEFPDIVSTEVDKKTKNLDELLTYLKDKIRSDHSNVEYVGEEDSDYVFLVTCKS